MDVCRPFSACRLAVLALAALLAGCKSAPAPAATPAPQPAATPSAARFAGMTDEQLVQGDQSQGLGLGLSIDTGNVGTTFKAGAPIPLRIAIEDFGASTPIASGMCNGFSLSYEETTTHDSRTGEITNPRCFAAIPNPDEIPLVKGKIKTVSITQRTASNLEIPRGTYTLTVTWKALPAGKGTIMDRPVYTTLVSNPVQITVVP